MLTHIAESNEKKEWTSGAGDFTKGQRVMLRNNFEKQGGNQPYLDADISEVWEN